MSPVPAALHVPIVLAVLVAAAFAQPSASQSPTATQTSTFCALGPFSDGTIAGEYAEFDFSSSTLLTSYVCMTDSYPTYWIDGWAIVGTNDLSVPWWYLVDSHSGQFWGACARS
jgi:hypothetical protein